MSVSIDGYIATSDGDNHWIFPGIDAEVTRWIVDLLWKAGVHIMGSNTYHDMEAYWPNSTEPYAPPMNQIPKVVFSKSLKHADWGETQIASGDLTLEIEQLKTSTW